MTLLHIADILLYILQSVLRLRQHCLLGPQVGGEITSLSGCRNDTKRKTRLDKNRFDYSPPYDLSTAAEMNITFGWADKYHITEHKCITPECSNDQSFRHFILHPLEQKIQQLEIAHVLEIKFRTILKDRLITSPNALWIQFKSFPILVTIWWFTVFTSGPADPSVSDNPTLGIFMPLNGWFHSISPQLNSHTMWKRCELHTAYTQKHHKCGRSHFLECQFIGICLSLFPVFQSLSKTLPYAIPMFAINNVKCKSALRCSSPAGIYFKGPVSVNAPAGCNASLLSNDEQHFPLKF